MNMARALFKRRSRHIPLARYHAYDSLLCSGYFKFAFVRNPWDRTWSAYRNLRKFVGRDDCADGIWASQYVHDTPSFESFVLKLKRPVYRSIVLQWTHFRPQHKWLQIPFVSRVGCDFVGRFETLDDDVDFIKSRLGVSVEVPGGKGKPSRGYTDVYSPEMAKIVGDIYRVDVDAFGYHYGE